MKKYLFLSLILAAVAPCSAQLTDVSAALAALGGATARERLDAIEFLAAERSETAYEALAGHFKNERDAYLRVQIVEGLNVEASTWAYACANDAAADANLAVRQAAALALAPKAGDPEADKRLAALGADPAVPVRLAVVSSLAARPSPSSAAIVGGILDDAAAAPVLRRSAAKALAGMKTKEADARLLKHAGDKDAEVKAAADSRRPKAAPKAKAKSKAKAAPKK
jgi:HEAT repeat protein